MSGRYPCRKKGFARQQLHSLQRIQHSIKLSTITINLTDTMAYQRIFGKELTNVLPDEEPLRHKRNYSFLHPDRFRDQSLLNPSKPVISQRILNRSQLDEKSKVSRETKQPEAKSFEIRPVLENKPALIESKINMELNDPQMVPEYFSENMQFMKQRERETHKLDNYLAKGGLVSEQARGKLIDWLSDLHFKFKMFPCTIFNVVYIIDQYLSQKDVPLSELQLVGISSFYLAAKFQQTYQVPQMKQLLTCCAGQYTSQQIQQKEADIIKALNFELIVNSAFKFFDPLSKVIGLEPKNYHLAQYVLELSLLQPRFLNYSPSLLASAAIYLIKKIRKSETSWNQLMTSMVEYRENELKVCAKDLCTLLQNAGEIENSKSLKRKFSLVEFHEVTKIKLERKDKK